VLEGPHHRRQQLGWRSPDVPGDPAHGSSLGWRVADGATEEEFVAAVGAGFQSSVPPELRDRYAHSISLSSSYLGLKRHVEKRSAA
jgi:hypothetical protein